MKSADTNGFTLVELMLAMVLFSLTMVIATAGFIGMNRSYNRSVIRKQLSESLQMLAAELTQTIQTDGRALNKYKKCPEGTGSTTVTCPTVASDEVLCFAGTRYVWGSESLYKQTGSASVCNSSTSDYRSSGSQIVNPRFKVQALAVAPVQGQELFSVSGVLRTKDDNAFNNLGDPTQIACKGSSSGLAQTCAVERFRFMVRARGGVDE